MVSMVVSKLSAKQGVEVLVDPETVHNQFEIWSLQPLCGHQPESRPDSSTVWLEKGSLTPSLLSFPEGVGKGPRPGIEEDGVSLGQWSRELA